MGERLKQMASAASTPLETTADAELTRAVRLWGAVRPFYLTADFAGVRTDEQQALNDFIDAMDDLESSRGGDDGLHLSPSETALSGAVASARLATHGAGDSPLVLCPSCGGASLAVEGFDCDLCGNTGEVTPESTAAHAQQWRDELAHFASQGRSAPASDAPKENS